MTLFRAAPNYSYNRAESLYSVAYKILGANLILRERPYAEVRRHMSDTNYLWAREIVIEVKKCLTH